MTGVVSGVAIRTTNLSVHYLRTLFQPTLPFQSNEEFHFHHLLLRRNGHDHGLREKRYRHFSTQQKKLKGECVHIGTYSTCEFFSSGPIREFHHHHSFHMKTYQLTFIFPPSFFFQKVSTRVSFRKKSPI